MANNTNLFPPDIVIPINARRRDITSYGSGDLGRPRGGLPNRGVGLLEWIQCAIDGNHITLPAGSAGASDGVLTGGGYNTGTGAIDFVAQSPGSNFSVTLPSIPQDLSDLTDTTDLLKSYTLTPNGTTGFFLTDENSVNVSSITYPAGTGDTFMTFVENPNDVVFTSADSATTVTIPKTSGIQTIIATSDSGLSMPLDDLDRISILGDTYTNTTQNLVTGSPTNSADITVSLDMTALNEDISPKAVNVRVEDAAGNFPTDNVEAALTLLYSRDHAAATTNDSASINFSQSGLDNQTITAIIQGADTALNNQILTSNGDGSHRWDTPTTITVDTVITDGATNPVEGNAIFDALALKADVSQLHVPATFNDGNTIDFTDSGTDNQTVTAEITGSQTALVDQVPTSNGNGTITWKAPTTLTLQWYDGGDSMRVWASYDPFATGYTKNANGDYSFVVPSGQQLDKVEVVVDAPNNLVSPSGEFTVKITTPTGNTSILNGSQATVTVDSSNGILHAGEQALGGVTAGKTIAGGICQVIVSNLSSFSGRKVSITNLIQNAS